MKNSRYIIPAGTRVEVRNTATDNKIRLHVTKKELAFEDRCGTGYNGIIFYFQYGSWVIAVNANFVK